MNRLILLAGQTRREGWKTLDSKGSVDYLATIPPLPDAVKAAKWDEIELIHGIGQLYPWIAKQLLCEIRSVLKRGGLLVMEQPNLHKIIACGRPEWIYGDPNPEDSDHMVKWSYTPESLRDLLVECHFRSSVILEAQHHIPERDFRIEARP